MTDNNIDMLAKNGLVDAQVWAEKFMEQFAVFPMKDDVAIIDKRIERDVIIGWFANAIENGKRYGAEHPESVGFAARPRVVEGDILFENEETS
jgi:hypothetical protein